jgi:iron complex transport system permease protein
MGTVLLVAGATVITGLVSVFLAPRFIDPFNLDAAGRSILLHIRLPRVLVAMLMGMGLGASGAVLQAMMKNPLADPYILGLSSGASFVAALGLVLGFTGLGILTVPALAFLGAMGTGAFVGMMGYKRGGIRPERLLLAGIGVSFMFSAALMLVMSISSNQGMRRAILWLFGDLSMADWSLIPYGALLVSAGFFLALWRTRALNSLMLGDDLSHSLGFSPRHETLVLFVAVGLMTAASVSLGGMVGFIGLLVPHIMRFFVGPDNRVLVPAAACGGAALLVLADLIGRTAMSPVEFPAGVITALLGAPYFLYILRRRHVLGI